jgi:hypothetical protein
VSPATANAIYDILAEECGARGQRGSFAEWAGRDGACLWEFRFQGALGFGGKFRADGRGDHWRVDCYSEDRTPERDAMIERANARLADLEATCRA